MFAVSTRPGPSRPAALSRARSAFQEKADLFEESIAGRRMLQEQMVSTGEGDEMSAGDTGGQVAPCVERTYDVAPHMHDKNRRLLWPEDPRCRNRRRHRNIAPRTRARSFQLQLVEMVCLLVGCAWDEPRGEHFPKAWTIRAPSDPHQSRHRIAGSWRSRSASLTSSYPASRPNRLPQHTEKSVPGSQAEGWGLPGARNRRRLGLNRQQSGGCRFKRQVRSTTDVDLTSPFCTSTGR